MIEYHIQIGELDADKFIVIKCVSKQHAVELMRLLSKADVSIETQIEGTTKMQIEPVLDPLLVGQSADGRHSRWGFKRGNKIVIEDLHNHFKLISTHAI